MVVAEKSRIATGVVSKMDMMNGRKAVRKNFIECSYRIQINGGDLSGR